MNLDLVFLTLALLLPLLWFVRQVHAGLQELFYLLTEHKVLAVYLFQVLLLPGVVLHEMSHYVAALVLRVRVRKLSFQPQVRGDRIQMGAIVMDEPDFLRGLLIGFAPLFLGSLVVVLIGQHVFDVDQVVAAATANDLKSVVNAVRDVFRVNDAWIWLYVVFAVSNAMLPSESDRASLWPMLIFFGVVAAVAFLAGWGPALISGLSDPVEAALGILLIAFAITLFVDVLFFALIIALQLLITLLTGRRLERQA
jgi:hypothetical protein